jgi:Zn-dependent protease
MSIAVLTVSERSPTRGLAFNLLPAIPLDGGRIFRSALWRFKGDFASATRVATRVGRAFAYLMIAAGILSLFTIGAVSGLWLVFIGWYLLEAAGMEARLTLGSQSPRRGSHSPT